MSEVEHSHTIGDATGCLRSVSVDNNPERHIHELKIEFDIDDVMIVDVGKPFFGKETNSLMISISAKIRPEFEELIEALKQWKYKKVL